MVRGFTSRKGGQGRRAFPASCAPYQLPKKTFRFRAGIFASGLRGLSHPLTRPPPAPSIQSTSVARRRDAQTDVVNLPALLLPTLIFPPLKQLQSSGLPESRESNAITFLKFLSNTPIKVSNFKRVYLRLRVPPRTLIVFALPPRVSPSGRVA